LWAEIVNESLWTGKSYWGSNTIGAGINNFRRYYNGILGQQGEANAGYSGSEMDTERESDFKYRWWNRAKVKS